MAYEPELEKLERRYQDDPARNFAQLAERYRKDGRLEDALTLLRGHLAERPNYVSGLVVLGRCLLDQQADGEARETFERVLGVDAEHIIALRALGEIAERAGDRDGAQSWFTRLLDVDPMNEEAQAALERIATMEAAPPPEEAAPLEAPVEPVATAEEAVPEAGAAEPTGLEEIQGFVAKSQSDYAPPEAVPEAAAESAIEPAPLWEAPAEPFGAQEEVAEPVGEQLVEPSAGGAFEETPDDELMAQEAAPDIDEQPSEPVGAAGWEVEKATDDFLPRVSQTPPLDIEQYPDIEISSQLPEEEPLIGGAKAPPEDEPYQFPTGEQREQEVDLGFAEPPAEAGAAAETEEAAETEPRAEPTAPEEAVAGEELGVEPFDSSLGWGAGERVSRQVTQDDIAEAEQAQQEGLDQVFHQIPGLESEEPPSEADVRDSEAVEGLQAYQPPAEEVPPIEGLEPTHAEAPATDAFVESVEPTAPVAPNEPVAPVEFAEPVEPAAGIAESEGFYVPPEAEDTAGEGLPDMGQPEEPETPLVLEAEPEPVVTETMAELYARQGLVNEAREVYQQLLTQRPNDPALTEKLADLEREMAGAHGRRTGTFSAVATGGQSARAFLGAILAAQPAVVFSAASAPVETPPPATPAPEAAAPETPAPEAPAPAPAAPEAPAPEAAVPETPAPEPPVAEAAPAEETTAATEVVEVEESDEPGPMDEAFGEEDAESEAEGAPTQPAEDEVSLSAVFGEETPSPTTAASPAPEPPQAKDRAPGGFSFDEFFGKAASEGAETPRRDSITDDEGDEAFKDWLKGLRT